MKCKGLAFNNKFFGVSRVLKLDEAKVMGNVMAFAAFFCMDFDLLQLTIWFSYGSQKLCIRLKGERGAKTDKPVEKDFPHKPRINLRQLHLQAKTVSDSE